MGDTAMSANQVSHQEELVRRQDNLLQQGFAKHMRVDLVSQVNKEEAEVFQASQIA